MSNDDKLMDKLAELSDVIRAADDVVEAFADLDDFDIAKLAEELRDHLSCAECSETEGDFDANIKAANDSLRPMTVLLVALRRDVDKAAYEVALDALDAYQTEMKDYGERL